MSKYGFTGYARSTTDIPLIPIGDMDASNIHLVKGHGTETASISGETQLTQRIKIKGGLYVYYTD